MPWRSEDDKVPFPWFLNPSPLLTSSCVPCPVLMVWRDGRGIVTQTIVIERQFIYSLKSFSVVSSLKIFASYPISLFSSGSGNTSPTSRAQTSSILLRGTFWVAKLRHAYGKLAHTLCLTVDHLLSLLPISPPSPSVKEKKESGELFFPGMN